MILRLGLVLALSIVVAGCSCRDEGSHEPPAPVFPQIDGAAVRAIDADTLRETVADLSSDRFAGRGPSSEGDRLAREYIGDRLREAGCRPGGRRDSWEQPIDLVGITSRMPETWSFRDARGAAQAVTRHDEYIGVAGTQRERVDIEDAEVVFAGYGIVAPEEQWDDFKGADLRGKILLMLNNDPDWDDGLFAGKRRLYYGRWRYKYESAARRGAVGAILIHTTESAGYPWQVVQTSWTGEQFALPAGDEPRLGLEAWLTEQAAARLVAHSGHDLAQLVAQARSRDFRPVPLGLTTSIAFDVELDRGSRTANVLGMRPGRDPALRDEYVVYTAHHDHLGIGEPDADGDRIYNGARDNAAGVATVLGVARAFAALPVPPRRSVLFLLVGAEEQGLLGSRYYAEHPTVHPGKLAADINVDSPNVFGRTRDVAIIGRGKSTLEDLLAAAAKLQGRVVVDEPFPDKGYYYRSDQFNFAKIGVPALYFKAGTELLGRPAGAGREIEDRWRAQRYHQPSDVIYDEWNFDGLVEDARLAFLVGYAAAEAPEPPSWVPGDEFEDIRAR